MDGNFPEAHAGFARILHELDQMPQLEGEALLHSVVLQADSLRDDGFTSLRNVLRDGPYGLFDRAASGLAEARAVTAPYVDQPGLVEGKWALGLIFGTHAKTTGLEARLVGARQLKLGEITLAEPAMLAQRNDQAAYGYTHKIAKSGNNPYVGASNAMCGARQEVVNGNHLDAKGLRHWKAVHVADWLVRASGFLAHESLDSHDRLAAARTIAHRMSDLRSRKAAMNSLTNWRTV
jgi:hypothetical protein